MAEEPKTFMVEDARLIFKNFGGREAQFNPKGSRVFGCILTDEAAEEMLADGWSVRYLKPQEEGDEPTPFISIAVRFDIRPPRIVLISSTSRTHLDDSNVEILDWADIETVDLIARSYYWSNNGKSGIKAYLQSMFVTIAEDALERKYKINEDPSATYAE